MPANMNHILNKAEWQKKNNGKDEGENKRDVLNRRISKEILVLGVDGW